MVTTDHIPSWSLHSEAVPLPPPPTPHPGSSSLTVSVLAVPAQPREAGGVELPCKALEVLVCVRVGQEAAERGEVGTEALPDRVVGLSGVGGKQPEHVHCAAHPRTSLGAQEHSYTMVRVSN